MFLAYSNNKEQSLHANRVYTLYIKFLSIHQLFFEKGSWRGGRVGRRRGGGMEGGGVLKGITILQVTLKFDKAVFV